MGEFLPLDRLEQIYRALSYVGRWTEQIQERAVQLAGFVGNFALGTLAVVLGFFAFVAFVVDPPDDDPHLPIVRQLSVGSGVRCITGRELRLNAASSPNALLK